MIRLAVLVGSALALSATLASGAAPPAGAETASEAVIVRVTIPGQNPVSLGQISWPDNSSAQLQSFAYPDDGSILRVGVSQATVSAQAGPTASAQAHAETIALSLFGGDVVAS